jgi:hypothetical protein
MNQVKETTVASAAPLRRQPPLAWANEEQLWNS